MDKKETNYQPKIGVIGIGGGGGSIVSEIARSLVRKKIHNLSKIKFVVANVDQQSLKSVPNRVGAFYFGDKITHGLGCGMNPELGEQAAIEAKPKIEKLINKCDLCIFVSSLGGGTGSGASPVFTQTAKDLGILSLGIFTTPFTFEGTERSRIARNSLLKAKENLNAYVVLPNQRIFKLIDENTPIQKSLSSMNEVLVKTLEGFIETLYEPGLINLDFSDFRATLDKNKAIAYLNSQEFSGKDRADKVVNNILNNPLIEYKMDYVDRILFNIQGSKDMKLKEIEKIAKKIFSLNPKAKIIFGVNPENKSNKIKITLLAVGGEKPKPKKVVKKKIEKIVEKPKPKKKKVIKKKSIVRKNALDVHKQVEELESKLLEEESKWDIPAFLREKHE